jgi:uncharacterized protein with NAD-binding domain and iron-sulfur cluster
MPAPNGRRVAILGGGAAGMTAAWRLSDPALSDQIESVTVYQRGWRLGGKGASSRGNNGRIEEHGLHVWLGYYENAFRLIREVYAAVDRPNTAPEAPIKTWTDAFKPASTVGLQEFFGNDWQQWLADFAENDELPGEPDADDSPMSVARFVKQALGLLGNFYASLEPVSGRPVTSRARQTGIAAAAQLSSIVRSEHAWLTGTIPAVGFLGPAIGGVNDALERMAGADPSVRRLRALGDLIVTTLRGIAADGLLTDTRGFAAVNDEEYREWMRRHGASEATLDSPLVRGVYDLAFGYEDGDPDKGRFAAGTGIVLSGKFFFEYKGAIFWKMQAGMGDVMFAPLYQAMRERGVRFEFFHSVDNLVIAPDGSRIEAVKLTRQVALADGATEYEPLIEVNGLPVFPAEALRHQLRPAQEGPLGRRELESVWSDRPGAGAVTIRHGDDFDDLVFAISVGMVPYVCSELVEDKSRWRDLEQIKTVATQAFQVWLTASEADLGWAAPGVTLTGFIKPFDTWASMGHLLAMEDWVGDEPKSLGYFCNTLPTGSPPPRGTKSYQAEMDAVVREHAVEFLTTQVGRLWPGAVDPETGQFDWSLLAGAGGAEGEDRFESQFWTANVDPSERYVQAVPGSDAYRLRADESGYDNLYLAGDWTNSGLNAGCVEAAVISGLQAANAVLGRPLGDRVAGFYPTMQRGEE